MTVRRTTAIAAVIGIGAGLLFFSLDLFIDLLFPEAVVVHALMESVEFLIIGPGVGLACALLVLRLRDARRRAADEEQSRRLLWLGRLAATMAHEIRNPLHNARLAVEALREEQPIMSGHPLLADLDDGLERIDDAVGLIYRLARPPVGEVTALDPGPVLASAAAAWPGLTVPPQIPCGVRVDPSLLRTAIDNLLRNAVEAAGVAGVAITATVVGGRWHLRVANRGHLPDGFVPAAMAEVRTGSPKAGGLGLGVAVASHIAALAGGTLDLHQMDGEVVADLTLPVIP